MTPLTIVFNPAMVDQPVANFAEVWGVDEKTLNAWCAKGWVPGAYKHGSGKWWVSPLSLVGFSPEGPSWQANEERERPGIGGQDRGSLVRPVADSGRGRIRRRAA